MPAADRGRTPRPAAFVITLSVVLALLAGCTGTATDVVATPGRAARDELRANTVGPDTPEARSSTDATSTTTTTSGPPTKLPSQPTAPAADRRLAKLTTITGELTPKSVITDGNGRFFAQNMMYSHTVNVYDRSFQRIAQLSDRVDLTALGRPGSFQGGPVEAAVSADKKSVYVSNYQMYGNGFSNPGADSCSKGSWDPSYVYRIDQATLAIDQIIEVGPVPKYVATTPDGRYVLVTNWCGYDLSVIDTEAAREVQRIPLGRFPRGIVVTPDSRFAYVAVMGSTEVAKVDLSTFAVTRIAGVGSGPRHLVISPDGMTVYATLNSAGQVVAIDTATDTVVRRVRVASQPRSMAISADGTALYVVNYSANEMTKLATADLSVRQTVPTGRHPIGITYDPGTGNVWVACYSGSLMVFEDR